MKARDLKHVLRARRHGARYAVYLIEEARREDVGIALAFAICEQETGFRNVFGHDPTIYAGAGRVTKRKYRAYKARRGTVHMQGVGPMQLTWWSTQDLADHEGGCWKARYNIRVGLRILHQNIAQHGLEQGVAAYNGSGASAQAYMREVLERRSKWRRYLKL